MSRRDIRSDILGRFAALSFARPVVADHVATRRAIDKGLTDAAAEACLDRMHDQSGAARARWLGAASSLYNSTAPRNSCSRCGLSGHNHQSCPEVANG